ncbi:MAG: hypothetical protein B7Z08_10295 [Sphingomonadales bacterium 32-68-7]|nr:MAG: hypothetical protein B7Z33_01085 [Sphingomonadales bacterium 12-68-11]OYX08232.1 MAG: hypothetical protein B7Z08_10295 [Sphingomonadales bacterium 32-68-7]
MAAALPSAGFALDALGQSGRGGASAGLPSFTPASADPRIARLVAQADRGARLMRFTPAGAAESSARPVTVAVRIDEQAARMISVRSSAGAASEIAAGAAPALRITPTRYNLGLARGYESFGKVAPAAAKAAVPELSRPLSDAAIPDLATFRPAPGVAERPSRFAARIAPDSAARADSADQALDLAGSYRLTRNLNVTAGVRYSPERDRLAPVADTAKQDSQAVYVGTQFRF